MPTLTSNGSTGSPVVRQPRLVGQSIDPRLASGSLAITSSVLYVFRVDGRANDPFGGVSLGIATAGATLTAGQNWVGVYLPDGRLLAASGDQTVPFVTAGPFECAVTAQAPFTVADLKVPSDGYVFVGVIATGTTKPALTRGPAPTATVIVSGSDALSGLAQSSSIATNLTTLPAVLPRMNHPQGLNGIFYAGLVAPPDTGTDRFSPVPGGLNSGNIKLNSAPPYMVFYRIAARKTGWHDSLAIEVRCDTGAGASYVGGTYGVWHVRFYEVGAGGFPDLANPLTAGESFDPNARANTDSTALGTAQGNSIVLPTGFMRTKGQLYCMTVENTDASPTVNYASVNGLYQGPGAPGTSLLGAQARNELDPNAADAYYNLDPREGIGKRGSDGNWYYPAGEVQHNNGLWVPVFIESYAGGIRLGQPYYTASPLVAGTYVSRWRPNRLRQISKLRHFFTAAGNATIQLKVNGTVVATTALSASAGDVANGIAMKEGVITPIVISPSDTVETSTVTDQTGVMVTVAPRAANRTFYYQGTNRQQQQSGQAALDHTYNGDTTTSCVAVPVGFPLTGA